MTLSLRNDRARVRDWNLLQESLGFGVSGAASPHAWFNVDLGTRPSWLTGGEYGLEASAVAPGRRMLAIGMALAARPGAGRVGVGLVGSPGSMR